MLRILAVSLVLLATACGSSNTITLLVAVDQVWNDSVIEAVERTIDIINHNNDTLPQYLLQYTTDKQVCTVQLYVLDSIYCSMTILVLLMLIAPVTITTAVQQ